MQDVCDADDRVSSILTSTSIASLLPLLLPFLLPKVQYMYLQLMQFPKSLSVPHGRDN